MPPSWTIVREARLASSLTQAEVAKRAGVTQAAVAHMERPGSNPTIRSLNGALAATQHRLTLAAEPYKPNVDETLIARNLRMTPAERVAAFETAYAEVGRLRGLINHG